MLPQILCNRKNILRIDKLLSSMMLLLTMLGRVLQIIFNIHLEYTVESTLCLIEIGVAKNIFKILRLCKKLYSVYEINHSHYDNRE